MKYILICLILSFVNLQNKNSIEITKIGSSQCATDIGRLNYKFKYQYTLEEDIYSYFLLNMKDQRNQKHSMLCKVELEISKENEKNGTVPEPSKEKKNEEEKEKLLDEECKEIYDYIEEQLQDLLKVFKLEEVVHKINEFQDIIEKNGLSEYLEQLFEGAKKVARGFAETDLGKKLEINLLIDSIYELMDSNHIFEANNEIILALSGISLKLLKPIKKEDIEAKLEEIKKNYQSIKDSILNIKFVHEISKFISKLKIMIESVKHFPDNYKPIAYKGIYKTIKNFFSEANISKLKEELKSIDLPDNIKEFIGKFDFLGQIGENIQKIFKAENVQQILDAKNEIKTLVDNEIDNYTENTSLKPIVEKFREIRTKVENKIDLKDSYTKFFNLIQSIKKLTQSINEAKEKLSLDNIIQLIREKDISELQTKLNEYIDIIAEKVKEKLNDEDVKLILEKLKKVGKSKISEELNNALKEIKDSFKELKEKNIEDKFLKLKDIIEEIEAKIEESELMGDFKELFETTKSFGKKLDSLFGNIMKSSLKESSESIKESIENTKTKLGDSIDKLEKKVTKNLEDLEQFKDKLKEILDSKDFDELKIHIQELKELTIELTDKFLEDSKLKLLLDKISQKIEEEKGKSEFYKYLQIYLDDIEALKADYQSVKNKLKNGNTEAMKEELKEILEEYKGKAEERTKEISEKIKNDLKESQLYEVVKPYSDLLEQFKEDVKYLFETKIEPKLNQLKELLTDPEKLKSILGSDLNEFKESIKNYNAEFESKAKEVIKDSDIYKELEEIKAPLEDFSQKLGEIKEQISENEFKDIMEKLEKSLGNVNFDELKNKINSIEIDVKTYLKDLEKKIQESLKNSKFIENINNFNDINKKLIGQLEDISSTSPTFLEQIEEIINKLKSIDSEKIKNEINNIEIKLEELFVNYKTKENKVLLKLESLLDEIAQISNRTNLSQMPILNETLFNFIKNISQINSSFVFESIKEKLKNSTIEFTEKMINLFTNNSNLEKLQNYTKVFKQYFTELKESGNLNITDGVNELSELFKNFKPTEENIEQTKEKLKQLSDEFKNQLENIITNLDDKFKDFSFYEQLKEAFINLNDALKQISGSNSLKPEDFAQELKEIAKKILKIKKESLEKLFSGYLDFEDAKPYVEKIKEFFEGLKDLINKDKESTLEEISKDVEEYIKNFDLGELNPKENFKDFINTFLEKINGTEMYEQYEDLKNKYQDSKDLIKDMNDYIKNYTIDETIDKIRDFSKNLNFEEIKNKIVNLIEEFKYAIKDNEKIELVKEKVEALLKSINLSELESAFDDLKNTLLEISKEQADNSKLKPLIEKLQELDEKYKKQLENSETYKNIKEYFQTLDDFKERIDEIMKNMKIHTWEQLKERIENGFNKFKGDLIEISDEIEEKMQYEDFKIINDEVKEIMNSKTVGELIDHIKVFKQILQDIALKYADESKLKMDIDKIKEFYEKVNEKILEFVPFNSIKELYFDLKDIFDNINKNGRNIRIQTFINTITSIKDKLCELPKEIEVKLQNTVDNLPLIVDSLEKVQEQLAILNQTKLEMCLENEITKSTKGLENKLRVLEESEILCKYDETPSEVIALTANSSELSILKNETYSLSVSSDFKVSVESYKSRFCNEEHIQNMKKQISFKSKGSITKEKARKRISFKIKITINKTYKIIKFFYIKMKIKIRKKDSYLRQLENEESDSFCLPSDNEDLNSEETELDCFSMVDNPDDVEDIGDFTSDFIDIPENATSFPLDNTNNGTDDNNNSTNTKKAYKKFYGKKSNKLSSGAIVGIILASVVAIVSIIALILLFRKKEEPPIIIQDSKIDSSLNIKFA